MGKEEKREHCGRTGNKPPLLRCYKSRADEAQEEEAAHHLVLHVRKALEHLRPNRGKEVPETLRNVARS